MILIRILLRLSTLERLTDSVREAALNCPEIWEDSKLFDKIVLSDRNFIPHRSILPRLS